MVHNWVESTKEAPLPPFAVVGGHDCDGSPIYVGRSHHEGECLPANVIFTKDNNASASVCWGGSEINKINFEILSGNHYKWVVCTGLRPPSNAVISGYTMTGDPLYIGRGHWHESLIVGKIHPFHSCLHIPFEGQEQHLDCYEVLTYGRHSYNINLTFSYENIYNCSIQ